jgi:glycosyl hydrolase family 16
VNEKELLFQIARQPKMQAFGGNVLRMRFKLAISAVMTIVALCAAGGTACSEDTELDFSKLTPTFSEDFDDVLSVSPWGPNTKWIAHTPWAGDFGDARFADPRLGVFPFIIENGVLRIEAKKGEDGKWQSGLLASTDSGGRGFAQQYGYFEIRAKLPDGPGVWPAFWLASVVDREAPSSFEVDILEYYGNNPTRYQTCIHVFHQNYKEAAPTFQTNYVMPHLPFDVKVPAGSLTREFNTYGALVGREWIVFYLNRREVFRIKTPQEHQRPLQVILNLALGAGWPIDRTPNPSFMHVDYVHVYKLNGE